MSDDATGLLYGMRAPERQSMTDVENRLLLVPVQMPCFHRKT